MPLALLAPVYIAQNDTGLRLRAEALLQTEIDFIPHPEFVSGSVVDQTVIGLNDLLGGAGDVSSESQTSLGAAPLLSAKHEAALFRQMNFLKFHANRLRSRLNPRRVSAKVVAQIEQLLAEAAAIREHIVRANLRLVLSNAAKFATREHVVEDLISDGQLSLLQAVDKFDFSRGFRFSTYATHAIRRGYFRRMQRKQREKTRLTFADPEILAEDAAAPPEELHSTGDAWLYRKLIERMSETLNEREQTILKARFLSASDSETPTFQALAATLGICKERVRQLQNRALEKMRALAEEIRSEIDLDSVNMEAGFAAAG